MKLMGNQLTPKMTTMAISIRFVRLVLASSASLFLVDLGEQPCPLLPARLSPGARLASGRPLPQSAHDLAVADDDRHQRGHELAMEPINRILCTDGKSLQNSTGKTLTLEMSIQNMCKKYTKSCKFFPKTATKKIKK